VPLRAAGTVLGALGLFGTRSGTLSEADLLVAQSLAHIACVAILQEHPPTASEVLPRLRNALTARLVVEQAKGFLRERLNVPVEDAFALLRRYARSHDDHLSDVARRLIAEPDCRPAILGAMTTMSAAPPS
jgi:ANTAR domain